MGYNTTKPVTSNTLGYEPKRVNECNELIMLLWNAEGSAVF